MANNYTLFSFSFFIGADANAWVAKLLDDVTSVEGGASVDDYPDVLDAFPEWNDFENVGFDIDISPSDDGEFEVFVSDQDGNGNVDYVESFIRSILKRFHPDRKIGFEFAFTCSKPRIGEFGGGACVVSANESKWLNTATWIAENLKQG